MGQVTLQAIEVAMSLSRVAAGAGTALLVVGAVVVFKPSSRLSAESFVSAAFTNEGGVSVVGNGDEINKLPVCKALTARMNTFDGVFKDNGGTAVAVDTAEANRMTADWLADGTGANANWIYVEEKPCICGKFAATTGRVCEATGNANPTTRTKQTYALAIPMIEGYDDKKIKVCTSTALQKKKCVVTVATAQTPNVPECKDA